MKKKGGIFGFRNFLHPAGHPADFTNELFFKTKIPRLSFLVCTVYTAASVLESLSPHTYTS